MNARPPVRLGTQRIGELQRTQQQDEFRRAVRAPLMQPLMSSGHEDFPAVRRQAVRLSEWFTREAGWPLHVEREGARLFKRPADLGDGHVSMEVIMALVQRGQLPALYAAMETDDERASLLEFAGCLRPVANTLAAHR